MAVPNGVSGSGLFKMLCLSVAKDKEKIRQDRMYRTEFEKSFMELADLVQMRLFKVDTPFWALALMGVVKEIDWKQRGFIDLKIDRPIRMTFNPMFIDSLKNDAGEYDVRVFIGHVVSELMRLVYMHPATFGGQNKYRDGQIHDKLERASDANVSELMKADANKAIMDIRVSGAVNDKGQFCQQNDTMKVVPPLEMFSKDRLAQLVDKNIDNAQTIEYYYHVQKDLPKMPPMDGQPGQGDGQDGDGNPDGIATPDNNVGQATHAWESAPGGVDETVSTIKDFLQELAEKSRGLTPSGVLSDIEKLLRAPERSYRDLIADMIQSSEVYDYEPTRMRRNRRFPDRLDLFGKKPVGHHHIYAACDSSGSTREEFKHYVVELLGLAREANATITVIECDASIQKVYDLERPEDFDYKVKGWGGTAFTPIIQFVNGDPDFMAKCPAEFKKFWRDPEESVLVIFTDGYGENEIPRPKVQKVLWVVSQGPKNLSVKQPYGRVVGILEGRKK